MLVKHEKSLVFEIGIVSLTSIVVIVVIMEISVSGWFHCATCSSWFQHHFFLHCFILYLLYLRPDVVCRSIAFVLHCTGLILLSCHKIKLIFYYVYLFPTPWCYSTHVYPIYIFFSNYNWLILKLQSYISSRDLIRFIQVYNV